MVASGRSGRQVDCCAGRRPKGTGGDSTIDDGIGDNDIVSRQEDVGGGSHFTVVHSSHHCNGIDDSRVANGKGDSSRIFCGFRSGRCAIGGVVDGSTRSGARQAYRQCIIVGARFGAEGRRSNRAHLGEVGNVCTRCRNREGVLGIGRHHGAVL